MTDEQQPMSDASVAELRQARLAHLGYWLCFGAAAGGVAALRVLPPFGIVAGAVCAAILIVLTLEGLYSTWDAMTTYEQ